LIVVVRRENSDAAIPHVPRSEDGVDIANWLASLGLERYRQAFRDHEIDPETLLRLTADDLRDMGVTAVGHRRRLLDAIVRLREGSAGLAPAAGPESASSRSRDAERRHLSVMFVDLVGSTALSRRLDPEDLRDVIGAYQGCCAEVVGQFEGYIAKYMGDGVLAYFGWPTAHEDDAERSLRAALGLADAVGALRPFRDVRLAVRVGIATGPVVVGDLVGDGSAREQAVVGETPNIAARLQALAEPGTVVIADGTRRLAGGSFEYRDLGRQSIAGLADPVRAWRVLRARAVPSRFDATHGPALGPLIGRDEETDILARRWALARNGEGQVAVLSGEPGIGKSRLVRALQERLAGEPHGQIEFQCSPFHVHSAFHPLIARIEHAAGLAVEDDAERRRDRLRRMVSQAIGATAEDMTVLASLLSLPGRERLVETEPDPERRKERILAVLLKWIARLAGERPLLCVFEDVHWSDLSTMHFLERLVQWIPSRPVLLIVTARPEFASPWTGLSFGTLMSLARLSSKGTAELVRRVAGDKSLPDDVLELIVSKTDGVALFVEEMTRAVLETDAGGGEAPVPAVPATLHDSLMARLDRLPEAREVAQLAAVIGRTFDYRLLAAVDDRSAEALTAALARLETAGLLIRQGSPPEASYTFKHALIQDAAYGALLRATRLKHHRRVAEVLERGGVADTDPALLAHHYAEGGLPGQAIPWLCLAGERSVAASAYSEAIDNLEKALKLLMQLPPSSERDGREIAVRLALGGAQVQPGPMSTEVEENYRRVWRLCQDSGTASDKFTALWGLWFVTYIRGDCERAREYGDRLLPLATELGDPLLLLEAHHVGWAELTLVGQLPQALAHTEQGIARYDRERHHRLTFVYGNHDPGLCARNINAVLLSVMGRPDEARRRCEAALTLAREIGHAYTTVETLFNALQVAMIVRDVDWVMRLTRELDELVHRVQVPYHSASIVEGFEGWALAEKGELDRGLALMRRAQPGWRAFQGAWCYPLDTALAAAFGKAGYIDEGLRLIDDGLKSANEGGAHWWDAEFHRVRAGLVADGADDLERAVATARARDARWLELRAATDLARLLDARGQRRQAGALLSSACEGIVEGADAADLADARMTLERLS
jgi:class 3 adenylate cyclase/tetratricopeptide (TPR) repeat protein